MTHASLFSGIGGFDLAAEYMGWDNVFNCEWEDFPHRVLQHQFPNAEQHRDIHDLDATQYHGRVDVLTGGFPCQPYSVAGKRKGKEDERHLWPEMLRVIRECSPRWVVGENVRGLVSWNGGLVFEEVCVDLEAAGYSVQPFVLPAAGVNAPHRRDRIWFVAYADDKGRSHGPGQVQGAHGEVRQRDDRAKPCDTGSGYAPDTDEIRLQHTSESGSVGQRQGETRGCASESAQADGGIRNASDTGGYGRGGRSCEQRSERREGMVPEERQGREVGSEATRRRGVGFATDTYNGRKGHQVRTGRDQFESSDANATDAMRSRTRQDNRQGEPRQPNQKIPFANWQDFPTVPPVCGGDDGLPKELDGITFSKWRRESIKAYGNAIVPQVAVQIFKAIQECETLYCKA